MMFQKRHYEELAKILHHHGIEHREIMRYLVADMIQAFKADNPNFDEKKFIESCGFFQTHTR